jgi:signal transduction histidine kinase
VISIRDAKARDGADDWHVLELTQALSETRTVTEVADVILRHGVGAFGASAALVAVPSSDGDAVEIIRSLGYAEELIDRFRRLPLDADLPLSEAIRTRQPILLGSLEARADRYPHLADARSSTKGQAMMALPLVVEGRAIGGICYHFEETRSFAPSERTAMMHLAYQCGMALERAQLRELAEQATRMVDEAARQRSEFMALLAHELRNPLAPIRAAADILELRPSSDPAVEHSREIIQRQAAHLARLMDDLLDASRLTLGKIRLELELLDLVPLVREVVSDHRALFQAHRVTLRFDPPRERVWVRADRVRLAQVVTNLLTNAAKFTDPGGCADVELEVLASQALIRVRDTGIGMTEETLSKIFEPFAQGERRADVAAAAGLGLGLALVDRLVTMHGGSVTATSSGPGRGSELTVSLPLSLPPSQDSRGSEPRPHVSRRVLLIEDNLDAAETLATYLEMIGHAVEVENDAAAGIDRAHRFQPEIILCDIGLPGSIDGYGVARALRASPGFSSTLLVALTGFGGDENRARALEAGFDLHATKPMDLSALASLVANSVPRGGA